MSRSGYCDDIEQKDYAMWRGRVMSAIRGKRGQKLIADLRKALEEMPDKRLVKGELQTSGGDVCSLGCVGVSRGHDFKSLDPEQDNDVLAKTLDVAECLIREIEYENDETFRSEEDRYKHMLNWAIRHLQKTTEPV